MRSLSRRLSRVWRGTRKRVPLVVSDRARGEQSLSGSNDWIVAMSGAREDSGYKEDGGLRSLFVSTEFVEKAAGGCSLSGLLAAATFLETTPLIVPARTTRNVELEDGRSH